MKNFFTEILFAVIFGAIYFVFLWMTSLFPSLPHGPLALSILVFCVFAIYIAIIDDERNPTRPAIFRILIGIIAGLTIAALNGALPEGYYLGAIVGALLGWLGRLWAHHI